MVEIVEKKLTSYGTLIVRVYVADAFDVGHLVDVPARSAEIEKAFGPNISQQNFLWWKRKYQKQPHAFNVMPDQKKIKVIVISQVQANFEC